MVRDLIDDAQSRGDDLAVTIRMYAVGFGDCFLVTVRRPDERPWRMLIDCGVHGMGRGDHPLSEVIDDIVAESRDEHGASFLDVVVATHRHQDHISGFTDARWASVAVGEVWLPWCEDPGDSIAQGLRTRLDAAARTLALRFAAALPEAAGLAFNSLTNEKAMATLREGFAGTPRREYLSTEKPARRELPGLRGGRVYLLGPSRSKEALVRMEPPKAERWLDAPGTVRDGGESPFVPGFVFDETALRARFPGVELPEVSWLNLEAMPGDDGLAAASWLDRALNNTSILFVLEVGDLRILFPGDAQWGAWQPILADPDARALLSRIDVYKVGHHGSHNGTPVSLSTDLLPDDVTSMMSFRSMERWAAIPKTELVEALRSRRRTLVRPDEEPPAVGVSKVTSITRSADDLWTEVELTA